MSCLSLILSVSSFVPQIQHGDSAQRAAKQQQGTTDQETRADRTVQHKTQDQQQYAQRKGGDQPAQQSALSDGLCRKASGSKGRDGTAEICRQRQHPVRGVLAQTQKCGKKQKTRQKRETDQRSKCEPYTFCSSGGMLRTAFIPDFCSHIKIPLI